MIKAMLQDLINFSSFSSKRARSTFLIYVHEELEPSARVIETKDTLNTVEFNLNH